MKKLQQLFARVALTLLLSGSAFAGIMEAGYAPPPPPPPTNATAQSDGTMETGTISTGEAATDPVVIAALSVLQSVLAQF